MIVSFRDKDTEKIWKRIFSRKFPKDIQRIARRKMIQIDSAIDLEDLKIPPGNRLHQLLKNQKGQYSISVNDQYRICFIWNNGNVKNVEFTVTLKY